MLRGLLALLLTAAVLSACSTPYETLRATAYAEIARAQVTAGDTAGARQTAALALAEIDRDDNEESRGLTVAAAATAQVRAGDVAGAEATLGRAGESESGAIAHAIVALAMAEAGHRESARRFANDAAAIADAYRSESKARERSLAIAAWVLARAGDLDGARRIERRIAEPDLRAEATALIARTQAETGNPDGAEANLNGIKSTSLGSSGGMEGFMIARGIAIDVFDVFDDFFLTSERSIQHSAWHAAATAFAKRGDLAGARRAFDRAINTADGVSRPDQRLKLLVATALAQAEAGLTKAALATLDYADRAAAQAGADAVRMLDAARSAIEGTAYALDGEDPDNDALYLIQNAIFRVRLGDLAGASASLERMWRRRGELREPSLLVAGLGRLAVALAAAGDAAAARGRAGQVRELAWRIPKTEEDRTIAMFFAAVALAQTGDIDNALAAAGEVREREKPPQ